MDQKVHYTATRNMSSSAACVRLLSLLFALTAPRLIYAQAAVRVVHVFVALADNQNQGIIPVPPRLGNGDAPATNLYWGAAFGVKSYFRASSDWKMVSVGPGPQAAVLERCVFKHQSGAIYVVADAYRGRDVRDAVTNFLYAAAGVHSLLLTIKEGPSTVSLPIDGGANLITYVGHDAFMDFQIAPISGAEGSRTRMVIVLACASKPYFKPYLKHTGANPLLWTTGLMAPEAYTLKAALDGWIAGEDGNSIRMRAAQAYDKYQHCGLRAAQRLFVTGW